MPILNPLAIDTVLQEAGLRRKVPSNKQELSDLLDNSNLSKEEVLETISELMRGADSSSTRLAAAKIGAELNGLLVEDASKTVPVVNIVIHDSEFSLNPIVIPRGL